MKTYTNVATLQARLVNEPPDRPLWFEFYGESADRQEGQIVQAATSGPPWSPEKRLTRLEDARREHASQLIAMLKRLEEMERTVDERLSAPIEVRTTLLEHRADRQRVRTDELEASLKATIDTGSIYRDILVKVQNDLTRLENALGEAGETLRTATI